jgi:hypothetical protein
MDNGKGREGAEKGDIHLGKIPVAIEGGQSAAKDIF